MTYLQKIARAQEIIKEAIASYPSIAIGCSFGKDSMVTLHLVRTLYPDIPVLSIMANTEFQDTYDFAAKVTKEWNLNCQYYYFEQDGNDVDNCCGKPKVDMTKAALIPFASWISGVRRTEGITRADFAEIEEKNGLVKINPILDFTELDIWRYTALNNLPINPKYQEGYRSLGCKLCSFPEESEEESERAGRWKGSSKCGGECGIHTQPLR